MRRRPDRGSARLVADPYPDGPQLHASRLLKKRRDGAALDALRGSGRRGPAALASGFLVLVIGMSEVSGASSGRGWAIMPVSRAGEEVGSGCVAARLKLQPTRSTPRNLVCRSRADDFTQPKTSSIRPRTRRSKALSSSGGMEGRPIRA